MQSDLVERYNYDEFVPANFEPWLNWEGSPPLGVAGPDFPLWGLDGAETTLGALWSANVALIVEFGSFT